MSAQRPPRPPRHEPFRLLITEQQRDPVPVVEPVTRWPSEDTGGDVDEDISDLEPMTTDDRIEAVEARLGELETKQDLTRKEVAMVNVTLTAVAGRLDAALSRSTMSGVTKAVAGTSTAGLLITVLVDNQAAIVALARTIKSALGH